MLLSPQAEYSDAWEIAARVWRDAAGALAGGSVGTQLQHYQALSAWLRLTAELPSMLFFSLGCGHWH